MLSKNILSELQKSKHSLFRISHIILPLLAILVVKLYYVTKGFDDEFMASMYYTLITCAFPIGISLMVAMSVGWEEENHLQRILGVANRKHSWSAKFIVLYVYGFVSILITVFGGQFLLLRQSSLSFTVGVIIIMSGSNLILYPLHMFLNFRFGKTISILFSFIGGVIGLVLLTGLGNNCWQWIPYSMAERLIGYLVLIHYGDYSLSQNQYYISEIMKALPATAIYIILLLLGTTCWFHRWEGRSITE